MKKLNLESLKERSDAFASTELLASITGGVENGCHADDFFKPSPTQGPIGDFFEPWVPKK